MTDLKPFRNLAARPRASLFSVLILLAGLPAMAPPLRAQNPPTYLFQIGRPFDVRLVAMEVPEWIDGLAGSALGLVKRIFQINLRPWPRNLALLYGGAKSLAH
jgi:hypothetical protein